MRRAALCLLAITAPACNWAFGIEETLLADAAPVIDARIPYAKLTYLVALSTPQASPVAALSFEPAPDIVLQAGAPAGMLTTVTPDATGRFAYPVELANEPWRLVYQPANDVPHEVHWKASSDREPHAVIPVFGRLDRTAIPGPASTLSLMPSSGAPGTYNRPKVFTTGVWSESPVAGNATGPTFTYNANQLIPLGGPAGAPESAKGDRVVLATTTAGAECLTTSGSATFTVDLTTTTSTTVSAGPWASASLQVTTDGDEIVNIGRAMTAAGTTSPVRRVLQVGVAPHPDMPKFTQRTANLSLASPLLLTLLRCNDSNFDAPPPFNRPTDIASFPLFGHLEYSSDRIVSGVTLTSGLSAVAPSVNGEIPFDVLVGMAVGPFMLGGTDLSTADQVNLPPGADPLVLTFGVEDTRRADYFDVLLHRIDGTSAILERVYTTASPSLTIDRANLMPGTEYVLQIRSYRGVPDAALSVFTRYEPAQSMATVWTRTFRTP